MPWEQEDLLALWDRLESWIDETLDGMGRCVNVDFSSKLSAWAEVADADRAMRALAAALPRSGLPQGALIAEQQPDGLYAVHHPPERAGEHLEWV